MHVGRPVCVTFRWEEQKFGMNVALLVVQASWRVESFAKPENETTFLLF